MRGPGPAHGAAVLVVRMARSVRIRRRLRRDDRLPALPAAVRLGPYGRSARCRSSTGARCQTCDGSGVQALFRTEMAVYFRCFSCNRVWGEPKPQAAETIRDAFQALTAWLTLDAGRIP
jgi:hypothetical protein